MIPYQYVQVDEASQVLGADTFQIFNSISYMSHPYEQRWPRISFVGDPYQLPPNTYAQTTRCYNYSKKLSFLELMTLECSPFLHGLDKIPTLQLNTQHRKVCKICVVANVVSLHNILTRILPPERAQMTLPARGVDEPSIIFSWLFRDYQCKDVTPNILLSDSSVEHDNMTYPLIENSTEDGLCLLEIFICTLSYFQGLEHDLIIFTVEKGPLDKRPLT